MSEQALVRTFVSLLVGEEATLSHTVTKRDISLFAELSGDHNPLHVNDAYAATTIYQQPLVHGMFLGALVSQLIGMKLPGKYALLMKESLEFKKPVIIGDTLLVKGVISQKSDSTQMIVVSIEIMNKKELVTKGSVHVRLLQ